MNAGRLPQTDTRRLRLQTVTRFRRNACAELGPEMGSHSAADRLLADLPRSFGCPSES